MSQVKSLCWFTSQLCWLITINDSNLFSLHVEDEEKDLENVLYLEKNYYFLSNVTDLQTTHAQECENLKLKLLFIHTMDVINV